LTEPRVEAAGSIARTSRRVGLTLIELAAIGRVGKPDAAVRMRSDVVRRVEALAVERVCNHRPGTVELVANDASR
jgi:hypothetical protein